MSLVLYATRPTKKMSSFSVIIVMLRITHTVLAWMESQKGIGSAWNAQLMANTKEQS
jgi:hypothetical protein